jgi:hypothetical protein
MEDPFLFKSFLDSLFFFFSFLTQMKGLDSLQVLAVNTPIYRNVQTYPYKPSLVDHVLQLSFLYTFSDVESV